MSYLKRPEIANALAVRTNRGPSTEDILLGDMMESPMSPTFPYVH